MSLLITVANLYLAQFKKIAQKRSEDVANATSTIEQLLQILTKKLSNTIEHTNHVNPDSGEIVNSTLNKINQIYDQLNEEIYDNILTEFHTIPLSKAKASSSDIKHAIFKIETIKHYLQLVNNLTLKEFNKNVESRIQWLDELKDSIQMLDDVQATFGDPLYPFKTRTSKNVDSIVTDDLSVGPATHERVFDNRYPKPRFIPLTGDDEEQEARYPGYYNDD